MQAGLNYHHTIMKDRKINVEVTAGGGGNNPNRIKKLKEKNLRIQQERVCS